MCMQRLIKLFTILYKSSSAEADCEDKAYFREYLQCYQYNFMVDKIYHNRAVEKSYVIEC